VNWDAIGAIAEALGAAGVIATLAYLAIQIRQNTRSQRTETYGRALDRVATLQGRLGESSELSDILRRGAMDHRSLTPNERVQFTWTFYEMFTGFEFIFHQAQNGALPPEVWNRWHDTLGWWLSLPGVQAWWAARPAPFTPDFSNVVELQIAAGRPDEQAHARWVAYITESEPRYRPSEP